MGWFKQAVSVQIASYDSSGQLVVYIDSRRYVYDGANSLIVTKLKQAIKYNRFSVVFKILRSLQQIDPPPKNKK